MATVDIKINNKTYSGVSSVNLPLADGSGYAPFNLDSSHIITKCSITYDLTDVTSSNTATSIASGSSFETTLSTSLDGRIVSGVVVTMGGTTLSGVYDSSTGVISITEVTDDISITATTAVDLRAPVFSIATPTVIDTSSTYIDTGLSMLSEDRDWSICFDVETLANGTSGTLANISESSNTNNGINSQLRTNNKTSLKWCNITVNLGSYVWLGEKSGNITKAVVTHVAGSGSLHGVAYAKNVANRVDNIDTTVDSGTFIANTRNLTVCACSAGSYQVNSLYVYYRVLDADEISAYVAHE
jgi:hypothetical protein